MSEKSNEGWLIDLTPEELAERREKGEVGILVEFTFDDHGRATVSLAIQDENDSDPVWAHMAITDAIRFVAGLAQQLGQVAAESQERLAEVAPTDPIAFAALLDLVMTGSKIHNQLELEDDDERGTIDFWARKNAGLPRSTFANDR